eukprot:TRINITY_DN23819_c0_g1_i2.p1 TRINITY_DN23819_c0_g1~~TRINITY_DN23819_c0_g1_i2.p1  ORF type:complete len:349 (+),score=63.85 TRINITY_DN23819_c0_g1_i2:125-1171(+)
MATSAQQPHESQLRLKPSFLTQVPAQTSHSSAQKSSPSMTRSASAPVGKVLPPINMTPEQIYGKRWTTETKRYLHCRRERRWLERKAKHCYVDFSQTEREILRKYFDELAGPNGKINTESLENMLISLGLADSRHEVAKISETIDDLKSGELDFEQYLELVRHNNSSDKKIIQVFKDMLDGALGDSRLNFQTVISTYRRQRILDAAGSNPVSKDQQLMGTKVLHNFSSLQRARYYDRVGYPDKEAQALGLPTSAPIKPSGSEPNFVITGQAPMGGLATGWRGVCHEANLVPSHPTSADGRTRRTIERPPSPSEVIRSIVKVKPKKRYGGAKGCVIIEAPAVGDDVANF